MTTATPITEAFEALMPKPDIRIDAFGEITASDRRPFVMGDYYTADQLHEAIRAATERAAKLVEETDVVDVSGPNSYYCQLGDAAATRSACAAAIRASGGMGASDGN